MDGWLAGWMYGWWRWLNSNIYSKVFEEVVKVEIKEERNKNSRISLLFRLLYKSDTKKAKQNDLHSNRKIYRIFVVIDIRICVLLIYICMYTFVYAFGKSPCLNITCVNILLGSGKKVLVRIFYIHLCICMYIYLC